MDTINLAKKIRIEVIKMVNRSGASHIGPILSIVDIVVVLYSKILNFDAQNPLLNTRDRFILSKGHAGAALYAVLAEFGFFEKERLLEYCKDGGVFSGHVSKFNIPGVEFSTGSLGHGLSVACGSALRAKMDNLDYRVFSILGDGELDEGSNWEALMFAAHKKLDNLCIIVDRNNLQSIDTTENTLALEPLAQKIRAFGWEVHEIDGHDHEALEEAMKIKTLSPLCLIANTVKGKGVSFMENNIAWHYRTPLGEDFEKAISEIDSQ
jgi:transketolase